MDEEKLQEARNKLLKAVVNKAKEENASSEDKNFARLMVAQRTVQDRMYEIGKKVLFALAIFEDEQSKQNLAALENIMSLCLQGLKPLKNP